MTVAHGMVLLLGGSPLRCERRRPGMIARLRSTEWIVRLLLLLVIPTRTERDRVDGLVQRVKGCKTRSCNCRRRRGGTIPFELG